ncbi:MAG: type II toxin-antitoxin system prevent-host-death family antitoxin [Deltaproteobacteria bacterium]|nr:type II toxin-antitoxin system prevent-host-death family antitoxin [Deltaproteobacteria bacterium]
MKHMGAAEFKARCLAVLDRLEPEGLVITKHGQPVARLLPIATANAQLIGSLKTKLTIHDEIFSTQQRWHAES